jgi:hypothetical protein
MNHQLESGVTRIVLELCNGLLDQEHILYLDNYYLSVDLAEKLITRRIDVVGTMRKNQKKNFL